MNDEMGSSTATKAGGALRQPFQGFPLGPSSGPTSPAEIHQAILQPDAPSESRLLVRLW